MITHDTQCHLLRPGVITQHNTGQKKRYPPANHHASHL